MKDILTAYLIGVATAIVLIGVGIGIDKYNNPSVYTPPQTTK